MECRLPINLREFLADQLGTVVDESGATMLNFATNTEEVTLSKLARAIRRYSTTRAHESWEECGVPLARFDDSRSDESRSDESKIGSAEIALCLACVRVEFGEGALARHQTAGCVSLALAPMRISGARASSGRYEVSVADEIRQSIEEFRRLRAAFGLPHFELDSYVRNQQLIFTWRPLRKP
ncbi:MAG TPA: hypothetical protein VKS22_03485 [Candidatus Binataceae bacterium]|nr:hypothetical protein [Candidatus Binataceae bacterium]